MVLQLASHSNHDFPIAKLVPAAPTQTLRTFSHDLFPMISMKESVSSRIGSAGNITGIAPRMIAGWFFMFLLVLSGCDTVNTSDPVEENEDLNILQNAALEDIPLTKFSTEEDCSEPLSQNTEGNILFVVCVPELWNGDLVVHAGGIIAPNTTDPQITPQTAALAATVGQMGYAFATISLSTDVVALESEFNAIVDLVQNNIPETGLLPTPNHVFLAGSSAGGLLTTLVAEQFPELIDGALAVCGPTGSIIDQVNYTGDFRVLFDYFYPGLIPGSAVQIPESAIQAWENGELKNTIRQAVQANPDGARQLFTILDSRFDLNDTFLLQEAIIDGLNNGITTTNLVIQVLGGQPFDNNPRLYKGSTDDATLNRSVARFNADQSALEALTFVETTGQLQVPYVSLHTTGDIMVPVSQQRMYKTKVRRAGASFMYSALPVKKFGHCNVGENELLVSFAYLVLRTTGELPPGAAPLITNNPEAFDNFVRISKQRNLSLADITL